MGNREIARLLYETADLMEIVAEDGFRIRSYRNAASAIESYPEKILDIVCNSERKVTEVPGVGKGIAGILEEICRRGSFEKRDQLLAKYPASALELLKIQGLGPKSIALLFEHFRVSTIDDLERICKEQKLRDLPRRPRHCSPDHRDKQIKGRVTGAHLWAAAAAITLVPRTAATGVIITGTGRAWRLAIVAGNGIADTLRASVL
jgi:hypothetical protein